MREREKERGLLFEIDPDNIRDLKQQKKVNIHLTNDFNCKRNPKERKGVYCLRWIRG